MTYTTRPATTEEIAKAYAGRKASFHHGIVEGSRRGRGGQWVTTHRSRSTAKIEQDETGVFASRKGRREYLTADLLSFCDGKSAVVLLRSDYLA